MIEPEMLYLDKETINRIAEIEILNHEENWQKEGYEPIGMETVIKWAVAEYYQKLKEDGKNG